MGMSRADALAHSAKEFEDYVDGPTQEDEHEEKESDGGDPPPTMKRVKVWFGVNELPHCCNTKGSWASRHWPTWSDRW